MTRLLLIALLLAPSAYSQTGGRNNLPPPKPKVLATPTPAPANPATAAKPPVRKRPPVKSTATLVAEYTKKVKASLGARWQEVAPAKVNEFSSGSLSVTFKVDAEGKVVDYAIVSNTSNDALAAFCEPLVRETVFEKPPAKALTDGQLQIPFNFSIY